MGNIWRIRPFLYDTYSGIVNIGCSFRLGFGWSRLAIEDEGWADC